jgi:hypothetical protein
MMFDLPHPFGPTTPVRLEGKVTVVGSTNDLKPAILSLVSRISRDQPLSSRAMELTAANDVCAVDVARSVK